MPGLDPCQALLRLLQTMHDLRAPGGCPWDAAQTPESLAPYILEEACEAIEAIEAGSPARIADELGDLLLQVVFQAEIYAERQDFDFADVAMGIEAKLRRRHPHVFATQNRPPASEDLDRQWERIKGEELAATSGCVDHPGRLPDHLPALQRAQKLLGRLNRSGHAGVLDATASPAAPLLDAEELGNALLTLVQRAEASGLDAEQTLRQAVRRLASTFAGTVARRADGR